eukprot:scaffold343666_cov44-Prasinocladus_malaysianus.AAC.1
MNGFSARLQLLGEVCRHDTWQVTLLSPPARGWDSVGPGLAEGRGAAWPALQAWETHKKRYEDISAAHHQGRSRWSPPNRFTTRGPSGTVQSLLDEIELVRYVLAGIYSVNTKTEKPERKADHPEDDFQSRSRMESSVREDTRGACWRILGDALVQRQKLCLTTLLDINAAFEIAPVPVRLSFYIARLMSDDDRPARAGVAGRLLLLLMLSDNQAKLV